MAVHVRQASLDAVVIEREPFVIDAEQVQDRGVEVVPGHWIVGRLPTDFIR